MKYRNTSLFRILNMQVSFVKYEDQYAGDLESFKKLDKKLKKQIKENPKKYSENSEEQSYMIFVTDEVNGSHCIGGILLDSSMASNLSITIQFDEDMTLTDKMIFYVLDKLVDALSFIFYTKEYIHINTLNNISMNKFDKCKYQENKGDYLTSYTYCNDVNYIKLPKLISEMKSAAKSIQEANRNYTQKCESLARKNLCSIFDDSLIEEQKEDAPLEEIFNKNEKVRWEGIKSKNAVRKITFNRNGKIHFKKKTAYPLKQNNYELNYSILGDGFKLKKYLTSNKTSLEIEETKYSTSIKTPNLFSYYNKEEQERHFKCYIPSLHQSSLVLEIYMNKDGKIEKCYVDFRTHRKNGKINGLYALRIFNKYDTRRYNLCFTSRKGGHSYDFINEVTKDDEILFSRMYEGELTLDLIEEMIAKIIPIINKRAYKKNQTPIALKLASVIEDLKRENKAAILFVEQIKDEIPLPHLQENMDKFIKENNVEKNYTRKRVLNKEE